MSAELEILKDKCRQAGLKITPQRMVVYAALIKSKDHPSAEKICARVRELLPHISLDTVNRTLNTLVDIGLAFVVAGSGGVKRFDGDMNCHQHFKCIKCKKIFDFHHEPFDNIETPKQLEDKFRVFRKTVYFEGLCDKCKK